MVIIISDVCPSAYLYFYLERALRLVMQDPEIDVAGFFYNLEMPDPEASKKIIEVYKEIEKPLLVFTWPTGQDFALEAKNNLIQAGVPVIEHIPSGLWAISALADWVQKANKPYLYPAADPGTEQKKALEQIEQHLADQGGAMTEWRSKIVLDAYGIPITREIMVYTVEEAVNAAAEIGYPVALKLMSPDLLHKTDAGEVALNISNPTEVEKAFHEILKRARKSKPGAGIEGVLVQEMLRQGLEVIIGVKKDPIFGPAVVFGLGGVFVEVLKDVSIRVAPLREEDARAMINEIKGKALLEGVRGRLPADIDTLVDILMKVSRLALELEGSIEGIDINPLIVYEEGAGAVAADALILPVKNPE